MEQVANVPDAFLLVETFNADSIGSVTDKVVEAMLVGLGGEVGIGLSDAIRQRSRHDAEARYTRLNYARHFPFHAQTIRTAFDQLDCAHRNWELSWNWDLS